MKLTDKSIEEIYQDSFSIFCKKKPSKKLIKEYLNDSDGEATLELQDWILMNMKSEISEWSTGIGVIDSVELLVKSAKENGNI